MIEASRTVQPPLEAFFIQQSTLRQTPLQSVAEGKPLNIGGKTGYREGEVRGNTFHNGPSGYFPGNIICTSCCWAL